MLESCNQLIKCKLWLSVSLLNRGLRTSDAWEALMWQRKDQTLQQWQFGQAGLQLYLMEGRQIHNKAPTVQILTPPSTQGAWGLDLQNGMIHAEDPASALLIKLTLCSRLAPSWSPALVSWLSGSHISKHILFSPFISKESISRALQCRECSDWK